MIEEKLATALRDTGEEISPHSVPPLRLRGAQRRGALARFPRRGMAWLTPLAAAAAVAAVVAASLAISATFDGHTRGTGTAAAPRWNGSPIGPASALRKVPPYFVTLAPHVLIYGSAATVRSTITGRVLATVRPPRPYKVFTWVSGAADDRTFVLAAQRWWKIASGQAGMHAQDRDNAAPTVFFQLTFDLRTRSAQLTRLTVPERIRGSELAGMAVSPDGTRLAVDVRQASRQSVQIVTLATGAIRTWAWSGSGWIGNWKPMWQVFSWTADGRYLEFQLWDGRNNETPHVLLLDTAASGSSLAAAKVIMTFRIRPGVLSFSPGNALLTPDGTKIVTTTNFTPRDESRPGSNEITEFSARTGRPLFSADKFVATIGWQQVLWTNADGSTLVIADPRGKKDRYGPANILGVLSGNRFTPIPHGADTAQQIAW